MTIPIFAEIGVNHLGDCQYAKDYVAKLTQAKVSAVTFQIHCPENTTDDSQERRIIQSRLLPDDFYQDTIPALRRAGILVGIASTDYQRIPLFSEIGVDFFKTLGADITCQPIFEAIAKTRLPIYISTAWATMEEIAFAIELCPNKELARLIYTDGIAGALGNTRLKNIEYFKERFGLPVAYGKHSIGNDMLFVALSLKPAVVFLYVKGDKLVQHPDDAHAVPLSDVPALLRRIEVLEQALNAQPGDHRLSEALVPEKAQRQRRRLVASLAIKKGELFSRENVAAIRPYGELSAGYFGRLMGLVAKQSYDKGDTISPMEIIR